MSRDDDTQDKRQKAQDDAHANALNELKKSQQDMNDKYESLLSEVKFAVDHMIPDEKVKKEKAEVVWVARVRHVVFIITCIAMTTAMLSYIEPRVLELLADNVTGLTAFSIALVCFIGLLWSSPPESSSNAKFITIDEDASAKKVWELLQKQRVKESAKSEAFHSDALPEVEIDHASPNRVLIASNQAAFARYVDSVVASLDSQIQLSEKKASMLLDQGTNYLRKGIYFFVASIISWQVVIAWIGFAPHMWVGIVSCSLTFFVVEFLAAWFLKQYRSYVDSSIIYLRVRSTFNKYLLKYHAVNEYCNSVADEAEARRLLLEALEEEIQWPELRDMNKNDFNFMLESLNSFTSVVDKLKSSLLKEKDGKAT